MMVAPKVKINDEPISISLIDPKNEKDVHRSVVQPSEGELAKEAKKDSYLSDKTRIVKEEKSTDRIGSPLQAGQPRVIPQPRARSVSVSDLGVKITTNQTEPQEKQKNWASNSLGEAVHGGQYVVRVQLLEESGAVDLDSAAVGALNKAGPYPNPPKGLLDENGNAQIRWDFVLKT